MASELEQPTSHGGSKRHSARTTSMLQVLQQLWQLAFGLESSPGRSCCGFLACSTII